MVMHPVIMTKFTVYIKLLLGMYVYSHVSGQCVVHSLKGFLQMSMSVSLSVCPSVKHVPPARSFLVIVEARCKEQQSNKFDTLSTMQRSPLSTKYGTWTGPVNMPSSSREACFVVTPVLPC